jgi:asparagine synthase (glutamine-hydrolysing)
MCGIAGIHGGQPLPAEFVARMTGVLRHRGPDDEGFLAVNTANGNVRHVTGADSQVEGERIEAFTSPANLFLGHRRLSIIDPTPAGHQPMANGDQTLWIVFNGEIYNYVELRAELKNAGYSFRTASDTEVILAAYAAWGRECVTRFNGMWSFVLYDRRNNQLFGSRDRFGVKPLYYFSAGGNFAFASEIKALLTLPFIEKKINPAAVFDYLAHGLTEADGCFFDGILELPPAHCFVRELATGAMKTWRYYTLCHAEEWERFRPQRMAESLEAVRELVINAVRLRLRSDVAVGSCLSGGVDSSTIVCAINRLLGEADISQVGERQKVFTACYDHEAIDESKWAEIVVNNTRTAWSRTYPKANEMLVDLEDLVYCQDVPFGSTSIYAQYRVMRLARENGVKVLLDGQGGDELFTGYTPFYTAFYGDMLRNCDVAGLLRECGELGNASLSLPTLIRNLLRDAAIGAVPRWLRKPLYHLNARENIYIRRDFWHAHRSRVELMWERRPKGLSDMLFKLMTGDNLQNLLRFEDRNSMRFSVESRTPFADDINLINYVFSLPAAYKIHNGWSKYLLRESMSGIVPDDIRRRKDKIGFATPEYYWLNELKDELREYLSPDLGEYLDVPALRNDWGTLLGGQSRTGITAVWRFINLAVWRKVYFADHVTSK